MLESAEQIATKRKQMRSRTIKAIPALMMPIIILGGIYGGVFTPTEAAAVAAVYSVPVGFLVYKGLKEDNFYSLVKECSATVGSIMTMIIFCLG